MRSYTHLLQEWVKSDPATKAWYDRLARKRVNTAEVYGSHLWKYWKESLSKRFSKISQWVEDVKKQVKSDDIQVSRRWARDPKAP